MLEWVCNSFAYLIHKNFQKMIQRTVLDSEVEGLNSEEGIFHL